MGTGRAALVVVASALGACATAQPAAQSSTVYRALGTEPFWSLQVRGDTIAFDEANVPGVTIEQKITQRHSGSDGSTFVGSPRLKIWSRKAHCNDGMSDRFFPYDVVVQVDERRFEGCGGDPLTGPEAP